MKLCRDGDVSLGSSYALEATLASRKPPICALAADIFRSSGRSYLPCRKLRPALCARKHLGALRKPGQGGQRAAGRGISCRCIG